MSTPAPAEETVVAEAPKPVTQEDVIQDIRETMIVLSQRLRTSNKGTGPMAGAGLRDLATAIGILRNEG